MRIIYEIVPALDALRRYKRTDAIGDLAGGLSVAAVAVPQAMAYALIAGLPAQYGLYTAIVMTSVGALFNSSRQLINGPTNAISIALLGVVAAIPDTQGRAQAAILIAFLVGAIQIAISLAKLGDLTRYVSHSVVVGFMAGASVLLVLDQVKNLLGQRPMGSGHDQFMTRFWLSLTQGGPIHGLTFAIGLGSILLILLLRFVKRRWGWTFFPEFLVTVVVTAAIARFWHLDERGVRVIGEIPYGLPRASMPNFSYDAIRGFASGALAIGLLGLLEATAMAKNLAAVTREKIDMNKQCLSEGIANLVGSFFSCMPGAGSLTRSAVNQQAGARTQWSGFISAVAVAAVMLVLGTQARYIPRSALAGLLMVTAFRMVKIHELRYHLRVSRFDAVVVSVTAIAALAVSIDFCILIGVIMSFLLAVPRAGTMLLSEFVDAGNGHVRERLPGDSADDQLLVFGIEGEMFFGSSASLEAHFDVIERRVTPRTRNIVLRLKRARNPDAVGIASLGAFIERLSERGVDTLLCGVRDDMRNALQRSGILAKLNAAHVFYERPVRLTSTQDAMLYAKSKTEAPAN